MNLSGQKHLLVVDIIRTMFGEPASKVADAAIEYGPCPIDFISQREAIPIGDVRTICLNLFIHGIINTNGSGKHAMVSINTFPVFVLAAPSILTQGMFSVYGKQEFTDVMTFYLLHGIAEVASDICAKEIDPSIDFSEVTAELYKLGFLCKSPLSCETFNSCNVLDLERRIRNLQLSKKRIAANQTPEKPPQAEAAPIAVSKTDNYSVNWRYVTEFVRGRYVAELISKSPIPINEQITNTVLAQTRACDYQHFKNLSSHPDDLIRTEQVIWPRFGCPDLLKSVQNIDSGSFFEQLDMMADPALGLLSLTDDSVHYDVKVPQAIRNLQLVYLESYAEQSLSPLHRRVLVALRNLGVADTRQLEANALVSDKDARCTIFELGKLGMSQLQAIPRGPDRIINQNQYVWRFDAIQAINSYSSIMAEHTRKIWARIDSLAQQRNFFDQADSSDTTAELSKGKCDKLLCGFHAYFIGLMRVYILLAEM